jgi:hypothetical protein
MREAKHMRRFSFKSVVFTFLTLFLFEPLANACTSTVDIYVDTTNSCSGGNDGSVGDPYCTLAEFITGEEKDLQSAGECYVVWVSGGQDTAAITFTSTWNTDATHTITITTDSADRHDGVFDSGKYFFDPNPDFTNNHIIIQTGHIIFDGLQFRRRHPDDSGGAKRVINITSAVSGIVIRNNIFQGSFGNDPDSGGAEAIRADTNWVDVEVTNNVFVDWNHSGTAGLAVMNFSEIFPGTTLVRYNTIVNCRTGIVGPGATSTGVTLTNNIFQDCTTDTTNNFESASSNNLSDQASGLPGSNNVYDSTLTFVNKGAGNFRLASGDTDAIGEGVAISGITTDIVGETRGDPPSIGAFEFTSAPPPSTNKFILLLEDY